MKISLEWLSQYLPGQLHAQVAADALTNGGLPVEVIEKVGDDTVIDVEVTSNRSDCLSHLGVARELAALLNRELIDVPVKSDAATGSGGLIGLRIDAPDLCPHYTARIIKNVKVGPSPVWMRRRLEAIGLRSINNVVDVTNYVMFEMGQPLHAFDFDKLAGKEIIVRKAKRGEKLISIDGHDRELTEGMLVIADSSHPVALAGVMGGRETEVTDRTVNILLESARFESLNVRATARSLAMGSDSSYRFERGIDPTLPERASHRAAQLLLEIANGELAGGIIAAGTSGYSPKNLWLRLARLQQILGIELPTMQVVEAFNQLRLAPQLRGERIDVTIPSHRLDLNLEIDLIEEAARIIGYDKVPVRETISITVPPTNLSLKAIESIRSALVSAGFFEAVTFSFVSDSLAQSFVPPEAHSLPRTDSRVRKADAHLRPSIIPGLLEAIQHNRSNGTLDAKLFEIGSTFWTDSAGKVQEKRQLALVGSADYRETLGSLSAMLAEMDLHREVKVVATARPGYAPGACGQIQWGTESIGYIGKVDRKIADQLSLRDLPIIAELEIAPIVAGAQHVPQLRALPRFPAILRDLSLVLPESTHFDQLQKLVNETKLENLESLQYVTSYRGKPLEPNRKSVTITLIFRSPQSTLTSESVEASVQKLVSAAAQSLGASLRA